MNLTLCTLKGHAALARRVAVALSMGSLASTAAAQATYRALPPTLQYLDAMNEDGTVIAGRTLGLLAQVVDPSGVVTALDLPAGLTTTHPHAVSDDGQIVVGSGRGFPGPEMYALVWDSTGVSTLAWGGATARSEALGVTGDGGTIVGSDDGTACYWDASGTLHYIGNEPGLDESEATDVSADGSVIVGRYSGSTVGERAFRWEAGTGLVSLGTPPLHDASWATHVSEDGSTVWGVAEAGGTFYSPWRWRASTGMMLAPAVAYSTHSTPLSAVSSDGKIAVGASPHFAMQLNYVLIAGDGTEELEDYATRYGVPSGGVIDGNARPLLISGDGRTIAGETTLVPSTLWVMTNGTSDSIETTTCNHGIPNQTGQPSQLRLAGTPFAAANDVVVKASQLPPSAFTMFIASPNGAPPVTPPGSIAPLCLGGSIGRFNRPGEIRAANGAGDVELRLDLGDTPTPTGSIGVLAGQTWHYQGWHRDVSSGLAVANFTNAVNVTYL